MAARYPFLNGQAKSEEPYHLVELQNAVHTPPAPAALPQVPLPLSNEVNESTYNAPLPNPLPRFNTVPYQSKIKNIIEHLRLLPVISMETLTFVNLLDQYYYGTATYDNGTWIAVAFNGNINGLFRDIFMDMTKTSK